MRAGGGSTRNQFSLRRLFAWLTVIACLLGSMRLVGWNSLIYFGWGVGVVTATMLAARYTRQAHSFEQAFLAMGAAGLGGTVATFCAALFVTLVVEPNVNSTQPLSAVDFAGYIAMAGGIAAGLLTIVASLAALLSPTGSASSRDHDAAADNKTPSFGWRIAILLAVLVVLGWLLIVAGSLVWT